MEPTKFSLLTLQVLSGFFFRKVNQFQNIQKDVTELFGTSICQRLQGRTVSRIYTSGVPDIKNARITSLFLVSSHQSSHNFITYSPQVHCCIEEKNDKNLFRGRRPSSNHLPPLSLPANHGKCLPLASRHGQGFKAVPKAVSHPRTKKKALHFSVVCTKRLSVLRVSIKLV